MNAQNKIEAATLGSALVAALGEMEGAAKDKVNPAFKSKYANLESVIDAVRPVLARHGLAFTQHTSPSEGGVMVETVVRHVSGEKESLGSLYVPANKNDAQGFGSALTYARRYSLMTAFGVPAEDDDGNAAAKSAPPKAEPVRMATHDQIDNITLLAKAAGKTIQDIVEAHKVASLPELTEAKAAATIKRLNELCKETADA